MVIEPCTQEGLSDEAQQGHAEPCVQTAAYSSEPPAATEPAAWIDCSRDFSSCLLSAKSVVETLTWMIIAITSVTSAFYCCFCVVSFQQFALQLKKELGVSATPAGGSSQADISATCAADPIQADIECQPLDRATQDEEGNCDAVKPADPTPSSPCSHQQDLMEKVYRASKIYRAGEEVYALRSNGSWSPGRIQEIHDDKIVVVLRPPGGVKHIRKDMMDSLLQKMEPSQPQPLKEVPIIAVRDARKRAKRESGVVLPTIHEEKTLDSESRNDIIVTSEHVLMSDFDIPHAQSANNNTTFVRCIKKASGEPFAMSRLLKRDYVQRPSPDKKRSAQKRRDILCLSDRHPNLLRLECAFDTSTSWILVMEFPDLGSLDVYIRRAGDPGLDPDEVSSLGGQILEGLAHLHGCDILHRDVKPQSIAICGGGDAPSAKVVDFGFVRNTTAAHASPGKSVGSGGFCAPEITNAMQLWGSLRHTSQIGDERADLYSFGVCLFVMLIGREADQDGGIWSHAQFRAMLTDPEHRLWHCSRYQHLQIYGDLAIQELEYCGALETISALTETKPSDRPPTALDAGELPLFTR